MQNLNEKSWIDKKIPEVFEYVQRGKRLKKSNHILGKIPYISSKANNNGIDNYIKVTTGTRVFSDCISLANSGSVGEAFYEPFRYVASDHVTSLKKEGLTPSQYLFLATTLKKQKDNFNFNREISDRRISNMKILLPTNDAGQPDYSYMEQYIINKYNDKKSKYINYLETQLSVLGKHKNIPSLSEKHWDEFKIFDNILLIESTNSGIDENKLLNVKGKIPYLTRKGATDGTSNGIKKYISIKNMENGYNTGNVISIGLDTQTAFYQPFKFITGQNIQIISGSKINKYSAMFLIPIIKKQMDAKFNWGGNGATLSRMKSLKVLLPINDNGNIDWQYMEQYSKNMIIKKYTQYLNFINAKGIDNNE